MVLRSDGLGSQTDLSETVFSAGGDLAETVFYGGGDFPETVFSGGGDFPETVFSGGGDLPETVFSGGRLSSVARRSSRNVKYCTRGGNFVVFENEFPHPICDIPAIPPTNLEQFSWAFPR